MLRAFAKIVNSWGYELLTLVLMLELILIFVLTLTAGARSLRSRCGELELS